MPRNLRQRGSIWWFRKEHQGRTIEVSLETTVLGEAKARRDKLLEDIRSGRWGPDRKKTFDDAVERFADEHFKALKPNTVRRYMQSIAVLYDTFHRVPVGEITSSRLSAFEKARRDSGVTSATIRRDLACLSSIMSLAETWEWVEANRVKPYLRARSMQGLTNSEARTRYLSHEEETAILAAAAPKARLAIAFAIDTGLRKEEQFSLEWSDVDLQRRQIVVRAEIAKNHRSRVVPLWTRSYEILKAMPRDLKCRAVFVAQGGQRYSANSPTMWEALQKAVARVSASRQQPVEHVEWHDLRRTCGCRLLQDKKWSFAEVRDFLGHSSVTVTERHYAFLKADHLHGLVSAHEAEIISLSSRDKNRDIG